LENYHNGLFPVWKQSKHFFGFAFIIDGNRNIVKKSR
jgi:hypothetical protein